MKELVVISGKGGTGKTSIVASFASLGNNKVIADCDVDASNLHLVLNPSIKNRSDFTGRKLAYAASDNCMGCGMCQQVCRFNAVTVGTNQFGGPEVSIDPLFCEGCGLCGKICPTGAIDFKDKISGELYISNCMYGPMVHARLGIAEDNSGKLVSLVKFHAKNIAHEKRYEMVLIDGSPGTGCPVISTITGASMVLIVTEPTMSGMHDLKRILELTRHFGIKAVVCINKCDVNGDMTGRIKNYCLEENVKVVGELPYDPIVTKAQLAGASVVEYSGKPIALLIKRMWNEINYLLDIKN